MLSVAGIEKSWSGVRALGPLDLELPRGSTTALIGPSGCGKSTLLRVLVGLVQPDAGQVRFAGAPVGHADWLAVRRRIGYVIQDGGLFPHLSARRNVTLLAEHLGHDRARIDARVAELASLVRLQAALLERVPIELSGGQRQRVALMRALMLDPEVLLLDEPLGALDPMIRAELQDDLAAVFAALGKTVVLVTHDLAEAAFFATSIVLLAEGRIVQRGSLADLRERPAEPFVEAFVKAWRGLPAGGGP